jgi:hypothetical protein
MRPSEGASTLPQQPELAYAPATPWRRRRRTIRRAVLALLLLAAAGCFWWWHEPLIAHGRLLYWQHKCQTHTFAPDAVVASSNGPGVITAAPIPPYWTSYEAAANPAVILVSGIGRGPSGPSITFSQAVVFIHSLRSPAGHERIVAVRCVPMYLTSGSVIQAFQPVAVEPAAVWPLTSRPTLSEGKFSGGYPVRGAVKVFGGQPDAADHSHFTIAYTVNGRRGVIDGWLRDDGTVDLRVREGSADMYPAANVPAAQ